MAVHPPQRLFWNAHLHPQVGDGIFLRPACAWNVHERGEGSGEMRAVASPCCGSGHEPHADQDRATSPSKRRFRRPFDRALSTGSGS